MVMGWFKHLILVCRSFSQLAPLLYVRSAISHYLFLFLHRGCHLTGCVTLLDGLLYNRATDQLYTRLDVREWPDLYDHTTNLCAPRRPQSAMDAHLPISHEDNPLYDGKTTPPTLMNDSTDVRLARAPEAGKLPLAMETRGEDGRWRVHAEWRGGAIGASVAGRAITTALLVNN
ncbi:hypothetical protein IW261DRAFT_1672387 [Armillaria novae-zelandiae]|uniref:Uncharacterized protein n=1 Tax=Armillaria novae-zelandiae TaxID=153914 RepID=A0AA39NSU5_9AGAR|nr:hypothetical protein IW261DRAFT_1672387 [Armillaria novae-zelandiae]